MGVSYKDLLGFVQHSAPTWRKTQHVNMALLLDALLQRPALCLSEIARAYPCASQPLHGRLKRLGRFVGNRNLDEGVLFVRWLKLSYRFGDDPPNQEDGRTILPVLLDTTYFDPFAMLVATVPCGSRGLPVALTTYHRTELKACFPPESARPRPNEDLLPPRPVRGRRNPPAASIPTLFLSQNHIEEELIDYVFSLASSALRPVLVADRGFARASLFQRLRTQDRDFVIRFDAQTHIGLPSPLAPDRPTQGEPSAVVGLRPGQRIWCPEAWYGKEDQVPISLLAVWDVGQKEPWYLASCLQSPDDIEIMYRWRMRLECTNRDEKTGVLLRESGDHHALKNLLHVHRLMLALALAEWLCALTGLQAWQDLPGSQNADPSLTSGNTPLPETVSLADSEPALPVVILSNQAVGVPPQEGSPEPSTVVASPSSQGQPSAWAEEPIKSPMPARQPSMADTPLAECALGAPEPTVATTPLNQGTEDEGPASPPPVIPHRGETPKLPKWMRPFAARGHLSYVRLGLEVLRSAGFGHILPRLVRWLADYLSFCTPSWRPYQIRYRLKNWWADTS